MSGEGMIPNDSAWQPPEGWVPDAPMYPDGEVGTFHETVRRKWWQFWKPREWTEERSFLRFRIPDWVEPPRC